MILQILVLMYLFLVVVQVIGYTYIVSDREDVTVLDLVFIIVYSLLFVPLIFAIGIYLEEHPILKSRK